MLSRRSKSVADASKQQLNESEEWDSFADDLKSSIDSTEHETRIPEFLQIILNMAPWALSQMTRSWGNAHTNYIATDRFMYLASVEPRALFRWKPGAIKFRIAWMTCQADDLDSFLVLVSDNRSLRWTMHCILDNYASHFEEDPDTKLTESKKNEWRKIIRSFEVRFEPKPQVSSAEK